MRIPAAILAILWVLPAASQEGEAPDPLFRDTEILKATLTGPLTTLVRKRPKDDYLVGLLEYTETTGEKVQLDLQIRARGHFRHEHCDLPPVLLNLKRKQTTGTLFEHQNKLKLVVQCERSNRSEQGLLKEYLAYRILNAVTDKSFRVRMLSITYVNTEKGSTSEPRYAFLIGNTDFSPVAGKPDDKCCHNYVLFGENETPEWAVPYDFDQSGFVDAPYAEANPRFRLRDVRQRLYRGRCVNNEFVEGSLQAFREQRDAIYALVEEQPGLKPYVRREVTGYIDDFYALINDPRDVERDILEECL